MRKHFDIQASEGFLGSAGRGAHQACLRFQGGATWLSKQEVVQKFITKHEHDADKWLELSELMREDLGGEDVDPEDVPGRLRDWGEHDAVQKRGVYAARLI